MSSVLYLLFALMVISVLGVIYTSIKGIGKVIDKKTKDLIVQSAIKVNDKQSDIKDDYFEKLEIEQKKLILELELLRQKQTQQEELFSAMAYSIISNHLKRVENRSIYSKLFYDIFKSSGSTAEIGTFRTAAPSNKYSPMSFYKDTPEFQNEILNN